MLFAYSLARIDFISLRVCWFDFLDAKLLDAYICSVLKNSLKSVMNIKDLDEAITRLASDTKPLTQHLNELQVISVNQHLSGAVINQILGHRYFAELLSDQSEVIYVSVRWLFRILMLPQIFQMLNHILRGHEFNNLVEAQEQFAFDVQI